MNNRFVKMNPQVHRTERERLMFIGAAGLAFSLFVGILFFMNLQSDSAATAVQTPTAIERPIAAIGTVTLLAPQTSVAAGARLSSVNLKEVYWPRNQVPTGAIREISEVEGLYAKVALPADVPLVRENITVEAPVGRIQPKGGYRAVTLEGDSSAIIEGHVTPGSKVDVILTHVKDSVRTSEFVVQNATVLSLGGRTTVQSNAGANALPVPTSSTVTLEVLPVDALKIQTAKTMGRLSLLLRSAEDIVSPPTTSVNQNQVTNQIRDKDARRGSAGCVSGNMKVGDKEYRVDCRGRISQISDPLE